MDRIPSDVEVAVRAAGENSRPYAGELPAVYRRARRRRAKRRAAAAFSAVAVVAGLVGGGLAVRQHSQVTPALQPAHRPPVEPTPSGPAQRLVLSGAAGQYVTAQQSDPIELGGGLVVGELTPDGRIVPHQVSGVDDYDKAIVLPDGRMVALGENAAQGQTLLEVELPGGDGVQRDIRRAGEEVSLVAATGTTAYLWRPQGLVAFDLTSGLERLVIHSLSESIAASDVVGDKLVAAESAGPCRPMTFDLVSLSAQRVLPLPRGCRSLDALRLSPSTGRVAVTYRTSNAVRVAVLSTEDGKILADRAAATIGGKAKPVTVDAAWLDERNLSVVAVPSGPGLHVLKPFTIPT
ncbi:hypothetical protein [Paractinoplanes lichenicola]|uniref:Uncharacterized protein n=1 Tax=Paractinoplanes lichenicola TaxID=2802976 RepID=A0ABS1VZF2_9ACTN|nr:hypothetical protein [Actinoplanes lichenicola]MBL7259868.1 hypothetical protein [Actinoplanes lichenicola]